MTAHLLGRNDEPQKAGTIVVVNHGSYRDMECWINSGANVGNWYPLGNEFGIRAKVWDDPRTHMEKLTNPRPPQRPAGTIPQHPHWEDVIARGPVTLLVAADGDAYRQGWRAGRRDLWQAMEEVAEEDPREVPA